MIPFPRLLSKQTRYHHTPSLQIFYSLREGLDMILIMPCPRYYNDGPSSHMLAGDGLCRGWTFGPWIATKTAARQLGSRCCTIICCLGCVGPTHWKSKARVCLSCLACTGTWVDATVTVAPRHLGRARKQNGAAVNMGRPRGSRPSCRRTTNTSHARPRSLG